MTKKILALILTLCLLCSVLLSCNSSSEPTEAPLSNEHDTEKPTDKPTEKPTEKATEKNETKPLVNSKAYDKPAEYEVDPFKDGITIDGVDISEFSLVYATDGDNADRAEQCATDFADWIYDTLSIELMVRSDSRTPEDNEILFGETNRPESDEAVGNGFENEFDFNAVLKDGKLAIAANSASGYLAALASLKTTLISNNGSLSEGFTNNVLSYDAIKELSVGSIMFDVKDDGLHFFKSTEYQSTVWYERCKNWQYNSNAPDITNGIRLDFDTNSSFIYFKVTSGNCTLLINGTEVKSGVSSCLYSLDSEKGPNRVTIVLPEGHHDNWALEELQLSAGAKTELHAYDLKMLILGDSITQGYNNQGNAANTYTFYTSQYFNANSVVQGNGGAKFDLDDLDPELPNYYDPDVIIVSFGTNDWSSYKGNNKSFFKDRLDAYLDKLASIYPDTPIIGITPINRLTDTSGTTTFDQARDAYAEVYEDHGAFVVDGADMLPAESEYYADTVHPNAEGFILYGQNLCAAIEGFIAELEP